MLDEREEYEKAVGHPPPEPPPEARWQWTYDGTPRQKAKLEELLGLKTDRSQELTLLRVLVACEFSGIVRDAFLEVGADAISCDLLESERPGPHYQGDVREILNEGWDLMIAHPPCTYLAVAGNAWMNAEREILREEALDFCRLLFAADIPSIAIENPVSTLATFVGPPSQVIQPWQYGHGHLKTTCLWLKGLWPLRPTERVRGRKQRANETGPNSDRWKQRSRTYPGVAAAMAAQWPGDDRPEGWLA